MQADVIVGGQYTYPFGKALAGLDAYSVCNGINDAVTGADFSLGMQVFILVYADFIHQGGFVDHGFCQSTADIMIFAGRCIDFAVIQYQEAMW